MPPIDPEYVRDALLRKDLAAIVGLRECQWMDVKKGLYPLDTPSGKEELAKDVAAFANGATGGLLLIGFKAEKRNEEEVVVKVRPLPRSLVDPDRYRKLVRERVMPHPQGLRVDWIECGEDQGVLVVDVPEQSPERMPFVVSAPTGNDKGSDRSVAIPVRDADGTHWLPQHEIRRLLAAGWKQESERNGDGLSALVTKAVSAAVATPSPAQPSYEIGDGEPGGSVLSEPRTTRFVGGSRSVTL